jgi:hypothetical protein
MFNCDTVDPTSGVNACMDELHLLLKDGQPVWVTHSIEIDSARNRLWFAVTQECRFGPDASIGSLDLATWTPGVMSTASARWLRADGGDQTLRYQRRTHERRASRLSGAGPGVQQHGRDSRHVHLADHHTQGAIQAVQLQYDDGVSHRGAFQSDALAGGDATGKYVQFDDLRVAFKS